MTRSRAIRQFCLECAGSTKDALLCTGWGSCPLWPHRTGQGPGELAARMANAKRAYAKDIAEMARQGIDTSRFFEPQAKPRKPGSPQKPRPLTGKPAIFAATAEDVEGAGGGGRIRPGRRSFGPADTRRQTAGNLITPKEAHA